MAVLPFEIGLQKHQQLQPQLQAPPLFQSLPQSVTRRRNIPQDWLWRKLPNGWVDRIAGSLPKTIAESVEFVQSVAGSTAASSSSVRHRLALQVQSGWLMKLKEEGDSTAIQEMDDLLANFKQRLLTFLRYFPEAQLVNFHQDFCVSLAARLREKWPQFIGSKVRLATPPAAGGGGPARPPKILPFLAAALKLAFQPHFPYSTAAVEQLNKEQFSAAGAVRPEDLVDVSQFNPGMPSLAAIWKHYGLKVACDKELIRKLCPKAPEAQYPFLVWAANFFSAMIVKERVKQLVQFFHEDDFSIKSSEKAAQSHCSLAWSQ